MKKIFYIVLFVLFSAGAVNAGLSVVDASKKRQSLYGIEDSFIQLDLSGSTDTFLSVSHLNICCFSSINPQANLSVSFGVPFWFEGNCDRIFSSEMNFEFKGFQDVLKKTGLFDHYNGPKASYLYMREGVSYILKLSSYN